MSPVFLLVLAAAAQSVAKGQYWECPVPPGFTVVARANEVPTIIADKFRDGKTAMLGESWQAGDEFGDGERTKGIEFVLHKGTRWIVGFGEGGFVTAFGARAFDLSDDDKLTEINLPPFHEGSGLCSSVTEAAKK